MEKKLFFMTGLPTPRLQLNREGETDRQQRTRLPLFSHDLDQLVLADPVQLEPNTKINIIV